MAGLAGGAFVSAGKFLETFVARVRAEAELLRAYGALEAAGAAVHVAEELEAGFKRWYLEALPIPEAAVESGYSEDRLRELVREGRVGDARAPGDARSRIRRCDLPRRAPDPVADVDELEIRLLRGAGAR